MIIYRSGIASLIAALFDDLKFGDAINDLVSWDPKQCYLSPGLRVKAMLINLFVGSKPLYRVHEGYKHLDTENLFGQGVSPTDFKDYSLARALDKLAEANPKKIFSTLAMQTVINEKVDISSCHIDTTSILVAGNYEDQEPDNDDIFKLAYGYNKEGKNDVKQYKYGLVVTKDRIPILADVFSGNEDDKSWNFKNISALRDAFPPSMIKDLTYVADSAVITKKNLKALAEGLIVDGEKEILRFISRLPATFGLEEKLTTKAFAKNEWHDAGKFSEERDAASYKIQEFTDYIDERPYRFLVVHSSKLDGRRKKAINSAIKKTEKELIKAIKDTTKAPFACEKDAKLVGQGFLKKHKNQYFSMSYTIEKEEKRKPGRPAKGYVPNYVYCLNIEIKRNEEAITEIKKQKSCFILISNAFDKFSSYELLKEYKEQTNVEISFKFLKDPLLVGPVFLKKPKRIEALSYVILMALLLFYVLERRVRRAMENESEPLIIPGNRKTFKPTGKAIIESFEDMLAYRTEDPWRRAFPRNLKIPERLLRLVGFEPDIYLKVLPPPR